LISSDSITSLLLLHIVFVGSVTWVGTGTQGVLRSVHLVILTAAGFGDDEEDRRIKSRIATPHFYDVTYHLEFRLISVIITSQLFVFKSSLDRVNIRRYYWTLTYQHCAETFLSHLYFRKHYQFHSLIGQQQRTFHTNQTF